MFKDIYKAANDDIRAGGELLEKVLQQKKRKKKPPVLKYSSIAAACAAVVVSLAAVPEFLNKKAPEPVIETAVVTPVPVGSETEIITDTADEKEQNEVTENADDTKNADKSQGASRSTAQKQRSATAEQRRSASETQKQQSTSAEQGQSASAERKQQSVSTEQGPQNAAETESVPEDAVTQDSGAAESIQVQGGAESAATAEYKDEVSVTQNTGEQNNNAKTVVLCVNSEDYGGCYAAGETQGYVGDLAEGAYESAEWSMDDYYEYLGEDVRAKLSLPADFSYIGSDSMSVSLDSNGNPSLDSMIFPYEGADGRSVMVMTSKNTLAARAYLEDGRYKKSDINGSDAVVIGGGGSYKCYMVEDGISYIVTAQGVSEDELTDILISIQGG